MIDLKGIATDAERENRGVTLKITNTESVIVRKCPAEEMQAAVAKWQAAGHVETAVRMAFAEKCFVRIEGTWNFNCLPIEDSIESRAAIIMSCKDIARLIFEALENEKLWSYNDNTTCNTWEDVAKKLLVP